MAGIGPFAEISRIQSEINRLFDNLLELRSSGGEDGPSWLPSADVYETEKELVVKFEVPGVDLKDVSMSVEGNRLIVKGDKRRPGGASGSRDNGRFHCMERGYGKFKRVVHISSPVNTREAIALLADGVLEVTFPKVPNRRGGEVAIRIREKA
jgi:HSP20 family protein